MPNAIRVIVVEDHAIVREGVRMILSDDPEIDVVAEAGEIDEALELIGKHKPDLVVLDVRLADVCAVDHLSDLSAAHPECRVIIWTGFDDEHINQRAISTGAHGLVMKTSPAATLTTAIKKVHAGEVWFDRALTARALSDRQVQSQAGNHTDTLIRTLTRREREIIRLIGEGLVNKDIAKRLDISEKTVRNHLTVVYGKTQVSSRLELAIFASRHKLIDIGPGSIV